MAEVFIALAFALGVLEFWGVIELDVDMKRVLVLDHGEDFLQFSVRLAWGSLQIVLDDLNLPLNV